jgi:ribose-phosphate pyrophosphokinase
MSDVTKRDVKHLMLFAGRSHPALANEIAQILGCDLVPTRFETYANSEIYVRFERSVRGCDAFVLQAHVAPVNDWLMEQLIMVDALKRASARRITVVCPFYPYARQDKKHAGREPISARLVADLYAAAGATRIMSIDLHAAQIQGFFSGPVDHLYGLPLLADYVETKYPLEDVVIVSPDAGRVKTTDMWSDRLGCPIAIIHKRHDINVANTVKVHEVVGRVEGKTCLLVDDMIDTGGTICLAAEALRQQGAARVIGAATHPVLSGRAIERLQESAFEEVIVTNTLPIPREKMIDKLTVLSIAPMIAEAIEAVFSEGSVAALLAEKHKRPGDVLPEDPPDPVAAKVKRKKK